MIKVENVSFTYTSEYSDVEDKRALDGIDLEIKKGEFVVIVGRNGSGKSTLGKLLNGLLMPTKGKIYVDGMDTAEEENIWKIRQKAGMVFQNPDNQLVATIVEEDVAFGLENLGVEPEEIRRRVDEVLKIVGMEAFKDRPPHLLSGGQKQRIAIAGVLAMKPECIILDEPTAMLDPFGRKEVLHTVQKLNREEGITIVYITHFMDEAVEADRIVVMEDAKIMFEGVPEDIFSNMEQIKEYGLDVPQAVNIVDRLNQDGFALPHHLLTVEKLVQYYVDHCRKSNL